MGKSHDHFSTRRIEALSDGVFAIAMTLLVLDLALPATAAIHTNKDLLNALQDILPNIKNFVISFLLLSSAWGVHQRQFEYIKVADRHLGVINTFRLMIAVLIPFTTTVANDYPNLSVGLALLPLNFALLSVMSYWQWHYATHNKQISEGIPELQVRRGEVRNIIIIAISFAVTAAVFVIGEYAFFLFLLTPFVMSYAEKQLTLQKH